MESWPGLIVSVPSKTMWYSIFFFARNNTDRDCRNNHYVSPANRKEDWTVGKTSCTENIAGYLYGLSRNITETLPSFDLIGIALRNRWKCNLLSRGDNFVSRKLGVLSSVSKQNGQKALFLLALYESYTLVFLHA